MTSNVLLFTPPFTQLNTPYPATAYLQGFLHSKGIAAHQADLGIEVVLRLFSRKGLTAIFRYLDEIDVEISENSFRIYAMRAQYIKTIDPVISFLQNKNQTLAHLICDRTYLPEAARFAQLEDLAWAFGTMGTHDKARHLATLYLEDLGDLIREVIDPHFGFTRYAERIARAASSFSPILEELEKPKTLLINYLEEIIDQKIQQFNPTVIAFTAPFPGNVLGAFQAAIYIKTNYPHLPILFGGGYANTELRRLADPRVFDYFDYVLLDDGEAPLLQLLQHLEGKIPANELKRTFFRNKEGKVIFQTNAKQKDIPQREVGTPSYRDLPLDKYLSVIELANPMHRLWSDGRWNKLTLAHGCYWGKCSFCDISLDYIQRYEPVSAELICDRIEQLIAETGEIGFHFVDEAAPPALLRDVSIEILRRGISVVWWTNIRFEKSFTPDLARLMKAAGCIALSGGLEVASDRLLSMMQKGVTIAQVAQVARAFTEAGIMVHAYLMYGFPTQTEQETIDSMEIVRQLFLNGVLQSGFWHQFAMTAHSPVGLDPSAFQVQTIGPDFDGFAENDLFHEDPTGAEHEDFSDGLKKSLFNYMHGIGLEEPLSFWFDFDIPETTLSPFHIQEALASTVFSKPKKSDKCFWIGGEISDEEEVEVVQGKTINIYKQLIFSYLKSDNPFLVSPEVGDWLAETLPKLQENAMTVRELAEDFLPLGDFIVWLDSEKGKILRQFGLLIL